MSLAVHPTSLQARQCMPVFVLMLSGFDCNPACTGYDLKVAALDSGW